MLPVDLEGRTLLYVFVVLPGSEKTRTLLGCDFIEDNGGVINAPQQCWYFIVEPERRHHYFGPKGAQYANQADVASVKPSAPEPLVQNEPASTQADPALAEFIIASLDTKRAKLTAKQQENDPLKSFFSYDQGNQQAVNTYQEQDWLHSSMCDGLIIRSVNARLQQGEDTHRPEEAVDKYHRPGPDYIIGGKVLGNPTNYWFVPCIHHVAIPGGGVSQASGHTSTPRTLAAATCKPDGGQGPPQLV